ncbi:right-handed parallel beta-helix repeat-containing protein [Halolamina pelagica]|nr:right-handed parallel beta-helix repeat-containing protein [Halolamina pelagica]
MDASSTANGEFASINNDQIELDFSDSNAGGDGLGLNSTYEFDDVFRITNQGTQPVYVWANFSGGSLDDDNIWFYPGSNSDRKLNDGTNEVVTLPVGETVEVGVYVDTSVLSSIDTQNLTATLTANVDVPSSSSPTDPTGEDAAVVSEDPDDGEYGSIQAAIDDVDGTTVFVEPGTYEENVEVNKSGLTLRTTEQRQATIKGRVVASSDGTTLDGFTVSPPAAGSTSESEAIRVSGSADDVNVRNNLVDGFERDDPEGGFYGVDGINIFGGSADDSVSNVVVTNNEVRSLRNADQGGVAGVSVQGNVDGATITGNTLSGIGEGVTSYGFGVTVRGTGNHDEDPADVTVRKNGIGPIESDDGPYLGVGLGVETDGSNLAFEGNTITDAELGVEVKAAAGATTFSGNTFDGSDIHLADVTGNVGLSDVLDNNDFGEAAATDAVKPNSLRPESATPYQQAILPTISSALDVSATGARIDVAPGTYGADAYGEKPGLQIGSQDAGTDPASAPLADVSIVGRGTPTIDGWVQILDPGVTFEGFEVTGEVFGYGLAAFEPDVTIRDVTVSDVTNGVFVPSAENVVMENLAVENYSFYGAIVSGRNEFGGATPTVRGSTFDGASGSGAVGIGVVGTDAEIRGNSITGNEFEDEGGSGVAHFSGAEVEIKENTIEDNDDGVFLAGTDANTVTVTKNDIVGNVVGVANEGSGEVEATGNWWGSEAGPGEGSNTTGTEGSVDADPWSTAPGPDWNTNGTPGFTASSFGTGESDESGGEAPTPPENPDAVQ